MESVLQVQKWNDFENIAGLLEKQVKFRNRFQQRRVTSYFYIDEHSYLIRIRREYDA